MSQTPPVGIACGSCGTMLPPEWINEPRDQRSPCPKCRGTQRRTAIPKSEQKAAPPRKPGLFGWISKLVGRKPE